MSRRDHSLLRPGGECARPGEVEVGQQLLHSFPPPPGAPSDRGEISLGLARLYGFFMGDGSCGYYPECGKRTWNLNNSDLDLLREYKQIIIDEYGIDCPIYDTMASSGVYKLNWTGDVKSAVYEYSDLFYSRDRHKRVPDCILNGSRQTGLAFLQGLYDADGDKVGPGRRIDQKSQVSCLCIYTLLSNLGFHVSVNTRTDKPDIYRLTYSESILRKPADAIKKN